MKKLIVAVGGFGDFIREEFPGDCTFEVAMGDLRVFNSAKGEIAAFASGRWAYVLGTRTTAGCEQRSFQID